MTQPISPERRRYLTEKGVLSTVCVTPIGRFVAQVDFGGDCWEWVGPRNPRGYGQFSNSRYGPRRTYAAHREMWRWLVGPVPDGTELDHLCRNPACVNPDHLEPVTHRENSMRGEAPLVRMRRSGICRNGHPFDRPGGGCRVCRAAYMRENRSRWKSAKGAVTA